MTNFFDLLKKLCATPGVAGFEDEVIILLQKELKPYVDKIEVDQLGNVIATKKGSNPQAPTIMIDAHIDEPSMLVKYIEESGFIRAERQGYPHNAALASQKIFIHTRSGPIKGVFGVKGLHQLVFSETGSGAPPTVPNLRDQYIDVGCSSKKEVEQLGILVGDPITYKSEVELLGSGKCAVGKAFDNRALVAVLIETMKRLSKINHESTVYALGSTMEELGLRGARAAMTRMKPDMFLCLDITVTADTPDSDFRDFPTRVGGGPVITIADIIWTVVWGMTAHPKIKDHFIDTAKSLKIPYQVEAITGAIANAATAYKVGTGIPAGELKVPIRYSHSPSEVLNLQDLENCTKLLVESVKRVDSTFSLDRPYRHTL